MKYDLTTKIQATFNPKVIETLRPEAHPFIGKRMDFEYCWKNGKDESNYPGSNCFINHDMRIGWVPEEDLDDIEIVKDNWGEEE